MFLFFLSLCWLFSNFAVPRCEPCFFLFCSPNLSILCYPFGVCDSLNVSDSLFKFRYCFVVSVFLYLPIKPVKALWQIKVGTCVSKLETKSTKNSILTHETEAHPSAEHGRAGQGRAGQGRVFSCQAISLTRSRFVEKERFPRQAFSCFESFPAGSFFCQDVLLSTQQRILPPETGASVHLPHESLCRINPPVSRTLNSKS